MRIVQIVFSPTGGTQRVADLITGAWGLPVTQFDLSDPAAGCTELQLDSQDLVLIAVPSFGGRVPALAIQRLGNISGGGARCAVVCVYGNRAYEDTLIELSDAAARCGFEVIAGVAAIAEHSIFHEYATGRPDAQDTARLQDIARRILTKPAGAAAARPPSPAIIPIRRPAGAAWSPKPRAAAPAAACAPPSAPPGPSTRQTPVRPIPKNASPVCGASPSVPIRPARSTASRRAPWPWPSKRPAWCAKSANFTSDRDLLFP